MPELLSQLLRTPQRARTLWVWTLGMWFSIPFFMAYYFYETWKRGYYPPEADSYSLFIGLYALAVIVLTPVILMVLYFILRRYRGPVSLAQPFPGRPIPKVIASIFFGLGVIFASVNFCEHAIEQLPWMAFYSLAWVYLLTVLWAAVFAKLQPAVGQTKLHS